MKRGKGMGERFKGIIGLVAPVAGLLLISLYLPCYGQSRNEVQRCSFAKGNDIGYYLNATENYVTKGDLPCFCVITDSLTQWSYKEKGTKYIAIIDSIVGSTDGVFGEQGEKVLNELFKHNFTNLCKYFLARPGDNLWTFMRDEFAEQAGNSKDKDAAIKKQRKIFSDKVKDSKLSAKEKTKILAMFNAIDYTG